MTNIEIPRVESLEGIADPCENIPFVLHFLLTKLLGHEQGLLYAEYRRPDPESAWYLRTRSKDFEGEDEKVAVLSSAILQSCAARLALTLDLSHKEGGYGRLEMTQEGRRYECRIYLSNCRESGYWIRVYAKSI
jgi:hypothetical protein